MFDKLNEKKLKGGIHVVLQKIREVQPDFVCYEDAYNLGNVMHTALQHWNIPALNLVAMARPETALDPLTMLGVFFRHPMLVANLVRMLLSLGQEFEPEIG